MKRFFFPALLALAFLILSACQQNAELVSATTPTTEFTASPTITETTTPSPTPVKTETPTLIPTSDVDFSQTIPATLAPSTLQGTIIFNRNYNGFFNRDYDGQDNVTLLDLKTYDETYLEFSSTSVFEGGYRLSSYSWTSGSPANPVYHPSFENFVWSNDGKFIAFPCLKHTDTRLCIAETLNLKQDKLSPHENLQNYIIIPEYQTKTSDGKTITSGYAGIGLMNSISWSPDNQELLAVAHPINGPKVQNPCLVQRKSKSVICGAENIFTGFTEHEYQLLSVVRSYAWSPIDKTQIAFILEFSIGQFKPGIYLLDNNEKQISILMEYPAESLRFDPNQKIIWSPDGKKLTFALYSDTTQYPNERNYFLEIVSIDISGKNFTLLFNTHDIYKKTAGIIPADFQDVFPIIYISSWLPDNEYILFEAVWKTPNILQDYLLGIFVYNIRTNETTKIKGIETISVGVAYQNHRLNPSWAP